MLDLTDAIRELPALEVFWAIKVDSPIGALVTSPDGRYIAIALSDGPVVVLSVNDGSEIWRCAGHAFGTLSIAWSDDSTRLASSGQDGNGYVYAATDGSHLATLPGGAQWVTRIAFEPEGNRIATAADKRLRLWSRDGALLAEWPERSSTILDLAWRPRDAGPPLIAATSYGGIGLYDPLRRDRAARELRWQGSSLVLAWSPNAKFLATGDQDRSVHLWRLKNGRDLMMSGYPRKVRELAWHSSSRYLATGGGPVPCIWNCGGRGPAGTKPVELEFHETPVTTLAYQSCGDLLATGAADGSIALWSATDYTHPIGIRGLGAEISGISWLPDDAAFAVGTLTGYVACIAGRIESPISIQNDQSRESMVTR